MTTEPQFEPHLDADQLTAFAEGALSASERALCLQHLAQCAHCREIAFLAGASLLSEEHAPAPSRPFRPSWLRTWWPALSIGGAALAAAAITAVLLHHPYQATPRTVQIASEPSIAPPVPLAATSMKEPASAEPSAQSVPKPSPPHKQAPQPEAPLQKNEQAKDAAALDSFAAPAAPAARALQQPPPAAKPQQADSNFAAAAPAPAPAQSQSAAVGGVASSSTLRTYNGAYLRPPAPSAQISGTITDSSGATIPHAKITLAQNFGTAHREIFTDAAGQFNIGPLQPGKYHLEISSPGFITQVRDVDLGTSQLARLDSKLAVGSAAETVTVQGAATELNTESALMKSALLNQNPPQTTVSSGPRSLSLDTSGKLFLSKKPGKSWKAVHGPWKKLLVTGLSLTPNQQFKVATSQGVWLSSDGEHWHPAD